MLNAKTALSGAGHISKAVRETTQFAPIKPKRKPRADVETSLSRAKDVAGQRTGSKTKQ